MWGALRVRGALLSAAAAAAAATSAAALWPWRGAALRADEESPGAAPTPEPRSAVVMGGGLMGVCTAYYLARRGIAVTVLESSAECASPEAACFAIAGEMRSSFIHPDAHPSKVTAVLSMLNPFNTRADDHNGCYLRYVQFAAEAFRDEFFWRFGLLFLANSLRSDHAVRGEVLRKLVWRTKHELRHVMEFEGIAPEEFDFRDSAGVIEVFRTEEEFAEAKHLGGKHVRALTPPEVVQLEPQMRKNVEAGYLVGGVLHPDDSLGNCKLFVRRMAALCAERYGVRFVHNAPATLRMGADGRVAAVETPAGTFRADAFIACTGARTAPLMATAGVHVPVYPMRGYSLSLEYPSGVAPMQRGCVDGDNLLYAIPHRGELRFVSIGEFAGFSTHATPAVARRLVRAARLYMPDFWAAYDREHPGEDVEAKVWVGMRPLSADGVPIMSRTPVGNLFVVSGHGTSGFKMSLGSCKWFVDVVLGGERDDDLPERALALGRFDNWWCE